MSEKLKSILLSLIAIFFTTIFIIYPSQAYLASQKGLNIWWEIVFPTLLPFFVAVEILLGFGVINFFEIILTPFMKPIFKLPGSGAFVMLAGMISGNPMGAKLTSLLRKKNMLTKDEAERLVAFTSTASPLFILGAIGIGFFQNIKTGILLSLSHYLAALLIGIITSFSIKNKKQKKANQNLYKKRKKQPFLLLKAIDAMHKARLKDGRLIGQLLKDSINSSINTLLLIGGIIIIFSCLTNLLDYIGIASFFVKIICFIFNKINLPEQLSPSFFKGIFEITIGIKLTSMQKVTILPKLIITSAILGFGGLSIHAQVISMLSKTDIRYKPYFKAKILHSFIASILTYFFYKTIFYKEIQQNRDVQSFAIKSNISTNTWYFFFILKIFALIMLMYWIYMKLKNLVSIKTKT